MHKYNRAKYSAIVSTTIVIRLATIPLAIMSTIGTHYVPNIILDMVVPAMKEAGQPFDALPASFGDINVSAENVLYVPLQFLMLLLLYFWNFSLINALLDSVADFLLRIAVRYRLGKDGYYRFKVSEAKKEENLKNKFALKQKRDAYKEKRRAALKRRYESGGAATFIAGLLIGLFIS